LNGIWPFDIWRASELKGTGVILTSRTVIDYEMLEVEDFRFVLNHLAHKLLEETLYNIREKGYVPTSKASLFKFFDDSRCCLTLELKWLCVRDFNPEEDKKIISKLIRRKRWKKGS